MPRRERTRQRSRIRVDGCAVSPSDVVSSAAGSDGSAGDCNVSTMSTSSCNPQESAHAVHAGPQTHVEHLRHTDWLRVRKKGKGIA